MNWTQLLTLEIETTYRTTLALLDLVDPDRLEWKPGSGSNWMTTAQLLRHIGNACGAGCKGFVAGDWGLPPGVQWEDLPPEEKLPPAEKLPAAAGVAEARRLLLEDTAVALEMIGRAAEGDLAGSSCRWSSTSTATSHNSSTT